MTRVIKTQNYLGADRRKTVRYPYRLHIRFCLSGSDQFQTSSAENISVGGAMFFSPVDFSVGDRLDIEISYREEGQVKMMTFPSEVIWTKKKDDSGSQRCLVGVRFQKVALEQKRVLNRLKLKILYIDDNISLTKLFACLGKEYNFEALVSNSIEEGIKMVREKRPDVVLTDIYMKDGNGLSLVAKLKSDDLTADIPIIGCSVTYGEYGNKIYLLGGSKFVNDKPYSIEKLNEILEGIVPCFLQGESSSSKT